MGRMLGAVGVMHLEPNNLAAAEVQDQVAIESPSLDLRRQERHIPAPDLAGMAGDVRGRWAHRPMEAELTGDVIPSSAGAGMIRARSATLNACMASADRRPAGDRLAPGRRRFSNDATCVHRCQPEHRPGQVALPLRELARCPASGSGGLPDGSFVRVLEEDRRQFFDSTSKASASTPRLREGRLVLAVQFPLQFLDPPPVLPRFPLHWPRVAHRGRRSHPASSDPARPDRAPARGTTRSCRLVHSRCGDHRVHPRHRRPALAAGASSVAGAFAKASARQRSSVAALTPTSRDTCSAGELSGGNSRATTRSLHAGPYRATS